MLSAYNINSFGILVYSGLPTEAKDITYENHNGIPHSSLLNSGFHYEVGAVGKYGLIHGIPYRKFKINIK